MNRLFFEKPLDVFRCSKRLKVDILWGLCFGFSRWFLVMWVFFLIAGCVWWDVTW